MKLRWHVLPLALFLLAPCGCRHFGPRSIVADRVPYNEAVATSWKEQTLLNVVKLRHMDTPFFVDIPQITSATSLSGPPPPTAASYRRSATSPRSRSNWGSR